MNCYRVYLTWSDGDHTTMWVDAKNERHACFLVGYHFFAQADQRPPADVITDISAVLETI